MQLAEEQSRASLGGGTPQEWVRGPLALNLPELLLE